jgi:predicted CXXCH cytochrome family protein
MSVICVLIALGMALLSSCAESKRHQILSFIFDGVPPMPGSDVEALGPDDGDGRRRRRSEPVWFIHDPIINYAPSLDRPCERCHREQEQQSFSGEVHLTAPSPQLCYECHEPPSTQAGWIHGPVAAGECVFCHEPHRSTQEHLLKKPLPAMCYQCHDSQAISEIEGHAKSSFSQCLDCHSGHASVVKYLLKVGPSNALVARTESKPTGLAPFDAALDAARADMQQRHDFAEMLQVVNLYIDQAAYVQARAYLLAIRIDAVNSDVERQQLRSMENTLDAAELRAEAHRQQTLDERVTQVAELYDQSIRHYHAGELETARRGFVEVLNSNLVPDAIRRAIQGYIDTIDAVLSGASNHRMDSRP